MAEHRRGGKNGRGKGPVGSGATCGWNRAPSDAAWQQGRAQDAGGYGLGESSAGYAVLQNGWSHATKDGAGSSWAGTGHQSGGGFCKDERHESQPQDALESRYPRNGRSWQQDQSRPWCPGIRPYRSGGDESNKRQEECHASAVPHVEQNNGWEGGMGSQPSWRREQQYSKMGHQAGRWNHHDEVSEVAAFGRNGRRGGKSAELAGHDEVSEAVASGKNGKRGGKSAELVGHDEVSEAAAFGKNSRRGGKSAELVSYDEASEVASFGKNGRRGGKSAELAGHDDSKGGMKGRVGKGRGSSKGSCNGSVRAFNEGQGKSHALAKGDAKRRNGVVVEDQHDDQQHLNNRGGGTGAVSATHLSDTKFASLTISTESKRALAVGFGYELMTEVQAATVGPLLAGSDVVARAKTGTGKTLAFLVPIVECIRAASGGVGGRISALVLSPTRELAAQITDECKTLLKFHDRLGVLCFYGGTNIKGDRNQLSSKPVDVLVATPGRLQDHLDNTSGFQQRLQQLKFLTLDEADQLLDMGFRDSIQKILEVLPPKEHRQGALFSATFPAAVDQIARMALRSSHQIIDTVKPEDEITPDQIDQCVSITNMEGMTELLWAAVHAEVRRHPKDHKIMAFFTTARLTQLYSELFGAVGMEVYEIHSRKSQAHRTKCADGFRSARSGIVFSSDVSARGLDYPDVTAVIQVGLPSAREQYIHRLGRTGRAGKSGRCILLLHDFEEFFLRQLQDLPLQRVPSSSAFPGAPAPPDALWQPHPKSAGQAYQAWLGYYNSARGVGWSKDKLVREATRFAASIGGLSNEGLPPPILKKTVGQMGLRGVSGLNIVSQLPYVD